MKSIILGGFLGSGKTTVLMQLVPYLVNASQSTKEYPVVVLENEISTSDVDSKMLRDRGMEVRTLAAGCICCTSTASLCDSLREIHQKYAPDFLVIEATGMAYPDSIAKILLEAGEEAVSIIALADAKRWKKVKLAMPMFVESQLSKAAVVFLNKTDLVDQDTIETVRTEILSIAPDATIYHVVAKDGIPEEYFSSIV